MQQVVTQSADLCAVQQTAGQELVAYQRKWDEELESFRKLAGRLQAAALEPDTTKSGTHQWSEGLCLLGQGVGSAGEPERVHVAVL